MLIQSINAWQYEWSVCLCWLLFISFSTIFSRWFSLIEITLLWMYFVAILGRRMSANLHWFATTERSNAISTNSQISRATSVTHTGTHKRRTSANSQYGHTYWWWLDINLISNPPSPLTWPKVSILRSESWRKAFFKGCPIYPTRSLGLHTRSKWSRNRVQ